MALLVNLLVLATKGLARDDQALVEFHGVEVGPPLFEKQTVNRLVIASSESGRGVFMDAAAREKCLASGLFCTDELRDLAVVRIPGLVFGSRPPAPIICEVLARLGSLSLAHLTPPRAAQAPEIQAAAFQAANALHAGQSPVLLADDETDIGPVLSHLSASAPCIIRSRSLLHRLDPHRGELDGFPGHVWYSPVEALEDADVVLSAQEPLRLAQRHLARMLAREPRILTGRRSGSGLAADLDPWLARRLEWIRVPESGRKPE
jgi:hypothetical protein